MFTTRIIQMVSRLLCNVIRVLYRLKPKVVFKCFNGNQYSDNPRAISEKLHELYPSYEIVWLVNKDFAYYYAIPNYVRIVKKSLLNLSWLYEISTCMAYVTNNEIRNNLTKGKKQLFIQTWHGDRTVKKILFEKAENVDVCDNINTSVCLAGSTFGESAFRTAFKFNGEILCYGCPRNDVLLSSKKMSERNNTVRKEYGIPLDAKILLYAPTFRDNKVHKSQEVFIDLESTLDSLDRKSNNQWYCLIRAHSLTSALEYDNKGQKIIDATNYFDMADLLCAADFIITDYSSCAFDFALTGKPVILALFDKDDYENGCREFKVAPDKVGFFFANNQLELENIIRTKSNSDFENADNKVNSFFGTNETGTASEKACEYLNKHCAEL